MPILNDITVLELCEVYQGPLAGQSLADFGARVIKVERGPVGDPMRGGDFHATERNLMSGYFAAANRNKESICLNLKTEAGCSALLALVKTADVLLHNYRPGAMERLGFGYDRLAAINPRLIYAAASGFGETGPMAEMAGQDFLIQSISGIASKGAIASGQPNFLNVPLTDYASGMLLTQGVLLALIERARSGLGQKVTVSLLDAAISMQSLEAASTLNYGYETRWFDRALNFAMEAADGWLTVLGFFRDNPLQLICSALDLADLSEELQLKTAAAQLTRRNQIVERLRPAFRHFKVADAVARLQKAGILSAPILDFDDALALPQLAHNRMICAVPVEGQDDMQVIAHPVCLSRTPQTIRKGPPRLGEHTGAVLAALGMDATQIAAASDRT